MSPQQEHWEPLFSVRGIRKLERLRSDTPRHAFSTLLRMHQSLLITREPLIAVARHHNVDMAAGAATEEGKPLSLAILNRGNPALERAWSPAPSKPGGHGLFSR